MLRITGRKKYAASAGAILDMASTTVLTPPQCLTLHRRKPMAEKKFVQCLLRHETTETTGWIEKRGAKVGVSVELLPGKDLWEVIEVFDGVVMSETMLKEHQMLHRGSLASVEPMAPQKQVGRI